jgi:hypothetical protein
VYVDAYTGFENLIYLNIKSAIFFIIILYAFRLKLGAYFLQNIDGYPISEDREIVSKLNRYLAACWDNGVHCYGLDS